MSEGRAGLVQGVCHFKGVLKTENCKGIKMLTVLMIKSLVRIGKLFYSA